MPETPLIQPPAFALLANPNRARILHTLALKDEPISTAVLARDTAVAYRVLITQLHALEKAGAVVADIPPHEPRQGREIHWSISQTWIERALADITSYLAPRT